ncbi:hypothetical protein NMG60_11017064 [Bertholletia excelsa]
MLQLLMGVAASAVPLMLLLPPMRCLSALVVAVEDMVPDVVIHTTAFCELWHYGFSWLATSLRLRRFSRWLQNTHFRGRILTLGI